MVGQVRITVRVFREGKWWVADVVGVPGAATETGRLSELELEVRDFLAGFYDQDDESFDLVWDLSDVVGEEGQGVWEKFVAERKALEAGRTRFETERLATLRVLHEAGVSVRDSGALVGVSHQRVSQLLNG